MRDPSLKNISQTLFGLALPLVVAAFTVPILIDKIGAERFGFLALAWGLIGYAGLLDLGVGRAVTNRVAGLLAGGGSPQIDRVIGSALRLTQLVGVGGAALIGILIMIGAQAFLPASEIPATEVRLSGILVALALPLQAVSATYRGVNEAYGRFFGISMVRVFLGVANFGGPFIVSLWTDNIAALVSTILVSRCVAFFGYRQLALRCLSSGIDSFSSTSDRTTMVELLRFGGWFTVSNALSSFFSQADRFFIGAMMSASAVTAYVLPYEIVVQSLLLVGAVGTVLFPALSALVATDVSEARALYRLWLGRVGVGMGAAMTALVLILPWLLETWLGDRIPEESLAVGQVLCVGVFLNSIGAVNFAYLHAHGKTRVTAIAHLVELPVFFLALYWGISQFGIVGAAYAWVIRVAVDVAFLSILVAFQHRSSPKQLSGDHE